MILHTGVKPSADASMAQAQPSGEDTVQAAPGQEAGVASADTGKELVGLSVERNNTQENADVAKSQDVDPQGTSVAGGAADGVPMTEDQTAKPDPATADAEPYRPSSHAAAADDYEAAGTLPAQATSDPGPAEQQPATSAIPAEAAAKQRLLAGTKSEAASEPAKNDAGTEVSEITAQADEASKNAAQAHLQAQNDVTVPMDEDSSI